MIFDLTTIVGLSAGLVTTLGYFPQVIRCYRTKSAADISLYMPCLLIFGISLWLAYGFLLHSWPIILANIFSLFANFFLLLLKIKYR